MFARLLPRILLAAGLLLLLAGCQSGTTSGGTTAILPTYQLTYVAVGASDAYGVGTDVPTFQSWPSVLAAKLNPHTHLLNLGIPGATVAEALRTEEPIAVTSHPNIITVWLALNDYAASVALTTYQAQLTTLLHDLQATGARIYVGNMPDLTLLPYFASRDQGQLRSDIAAWNAAIAAVCTTTGVHLVNIYADFGEVATNPGLLSDDGLHPSVAGAQRLADYFAAAIQP